MNPINTDSTLSSKGQTTLPKEVRDKLGLNTGDKLIYEIEGRTVRVRKMEPFDAIYHAALSQNMTEWGSKEDEAAFGDL